MNGSRVRPPRLQLRRRTVLGTRGRVPGPWNRHPRFSWRAMPQFFPRTANAVFRLSLLGMVALVSLVAWLGALVVRSPYEMMQDVPRNEPVPFRHEHHAGGLGLDCRYCHTSVEGQG